MDEVSLGKKRFRGIGADPTSYCRNYLELRMSWFWAPEVNWLPSNIGLDSRGKESLSFLLEWNGWQEIKIFW